MSGNPIGEEGFMMVEEVLKCNSALTSLHLSREVLMSVHFKRRDK